MFGRMTSGFLLAVPVPSSGKNLQNPRHHGIHPQHPSNTFVPAGQHAGIRPEELDAAFRERLLADVNAAAGELVVHYRPGGDDEVVPAGAEHAVDFHDLLDLDERQLAMGPRRGH